MCSPNITIYTQHTGDKSYTYFCVYIKGQRHLFKTKSAAQEFIRQTNRLSDKVGLQAATLAAKNPIAVAAAISMIDEAGLDLGHLCYAVKEYLARLKTQHGTATLGETVKAYKKFLKYRVAPSTYSTAKQACNLLVKHFGEDAKPYEHSREEYAEWFESHVAINKKGNSIAPATYNSILRRLKTFARWSAESGWSVPENAFNYIHPKLEPAKEPRFIKLDEMWELLKAATNDEFHRKEVFAFMALSFFAGIRTAEILSLKPEDFHYLEDEPYIRVSTAKGASYGRRGRIVPLEPIAAQILRTAYPDQPPFFSRMTLWIMKSYYCDKFIEDHHNIARHSFITYHVAKYGDEQKTVTICGTSKEMAATHYKGLATKSQADAYFELVSQEMLDRLSERPAPDFPAESDE